MDETPNPYRAPVGDSPPLRPEAFRGARLPGSRWERLGASILDGVMVGLPMTLLVLVAVFATMRIGGAEAFAWVEVDEDAGILRSQLPASGSEFAIEVALTGLMLGFWTLINLHLLRQGQTLGKRACGLRIVDADDGTVPDLCRLIWKREGLVYAISLVPLVGPVVGLVDILFIFRQDRRCLHDHWSGTVVVKA